MKSCDQIGNSLVTAGLTMEDTDPPTRQRLQSKLLAGTLITSTLGQSGNTNKTSQWNQERQAYFGLIDSLTGEISARFGEANIALFQSITSLQPSSPIFLTDDARKPLQQIFCL